MTLGAAATGKGAKSATESPKCLATRQQPAVGECEAAVLLKSVP